MHWRFSLSWFRQILVSLNRFWVLTGKCFEITIRHHNLANAQITRNAPRTGRATNTFWFRTSQNRSFCSGSLIIFFLTCPCTHGVNDIRDFLNTISHDWAYPYHHTIPMSALFLGDQDWYQRLWSYWSYGLPGAHFLLLQWRPTKVVIWACWLRRL